ncbi:hypothetical protein HWV62_12326 [Athelia sp. TMB]|nr:hypothetical protein HWV62_12326 [Athelia sp. TMB]
MAAIFNTQENLGGTVYNINGDYHEHQIPSDFFHVLGRHIEETMSHFSLAIRSAAERSNIFDHLHEAHSAISVARDSGHLPHTCRNAVAQGVADTCHATAIHSIAQLHMMIIAIRLMKHHPTLCSSQHLSETLADLENVLTWTERAVEAYHNTPLSESLSRKISLEVVDCRRLLEELLGYLSDWRRILSHIVLDLIQKYVCGKIGRSDAINTLDLKLRESHKSFAACLLALSRRGDYRIWKPSDDTFIYPAEISVKLRPWMKVEMSIVVHELVEIKHHREARRINVLQDSPRGKNETQAEIVRDSEELGAKTTEVGETSHQLVDEQVSEENIAARGDAMRMTDEDAGEPTFEEGEGSEAQELEDTDEHLTSSSGIWSTPDVACSAPVPLAQVPSSSDPSVIEAHLSECSTSSSRSSICTDADKLFKEDIIIAVMGPTGAGKSSFISKAIGSEGETVGHGLESCTQYVRAVRCRHPDDPRSFVFVDTPGFDDTNLSDAEILIRIATWLTATYQQHIFITAILYLHRISDNRMAGSALRNMDMFRRLCGNDALPNVVLVSTMWDQVDRITGQKREQELRDTFWRSMVDNGARTARFYHTPASAWEILGPYTGHFRPVKLQIQMEMVDKGIPLSQTAAGSFLKSWLTVLSKQFKIFLARCQKALRRTSKQHDERVDPIDRMEIATQSNKVEKVKAQLNLLDDGSSVYSDTSSTSTTLFTTAPSSPATNRPYSIPLARESLVSLLSRGGMKRDEAKMWAMYGNPGTKS